MTWACRLISSPISSRDIRRLRSSPTAAPRESSAGVTFRVLARSILISSASTVCALYISDNLGTQIDGLGHITSGEDNHWYNGFKESDWGGDFGIRKADANGIPPIVGRAILIDVAGWKGVYALPPNFAITSKELQAALAAQGMDVTPGDIVFLRTGALRHWGKNGSDHETIAKYDSAGLTLEGAKWLVEQKGAVLIGSDTSGLEVGQDPKIPGRAIPVHEYLLVEQGVHIGEFHNLEGLAKNKVYRFAYVAMTNRLIGAVAGTAMRPDCDRVIQPPRHRSAAREQRMHPLVMNPLVRRRRFAAPALLCLAAMITANMADGRRRDRRNT